MNAAAVAVDLAKTVFQLAVADASWKVVESHRLTRIQFERWFANREVDLVIREACGSAHHWARRLNGLGINVKRKNVGFRSCMSASRSPSTFVYPYRPAHCRIVYPKKPRNPCHRMLARQIRPCHGFIPVIAPFEICQRPGNRLALRAGNFIQFGFLFNPRLHLAHKCFRPQIEGRQP